MKAQKYDVGDKYEIPEEGSLGLLAIGYKGILAWRCRKLGVKDTGQIIGPVLYNKELKVSVIGDEKKESK